MSRDAIEDLVHRYADAVVRGDADQWSGTWAEDAAWVLAPDRRVDGRDTIVALWRDAMGRFDAVIQTVLNGSADLHGDAGTGRWYLQESWLRTDDRRGILLGHYDDRYVRRDGTWLFAERTLVVHYQGPADLSGDFSSSGG